MSIGILALIIGALCGVVFLIMAPHQIEKSRKLCGDYGQALIRAEIPQEVFR